MSGIDIVAPRQPFHDFGRSMPNPLAGDHNARTIVSFDDVARFDIGSTICADDLPIGTAWKNPSIELWPAHAAAEDTDHAPLTVGCAAQTGDALELCENRENGLLPEHDRQSVGAPTCDR